VPLELDGPDSRSSGMQPLVIDSMACEGNTGNARLDIQYVGNEP